MITLDDYWMGRNKQFAAALNPQIEACAAVTVARANLLLEAFYAVHPTAAPRHVNSGWRPPEVNAQVQGAAFNSRHMSGQAVDLSDDDKMLGNWCLSPNGLDALKRIGLWIESPTATRVWLHAQIVPPASKRRVFIP